MAMRADAVGGDHLAPLLSAERRTEHSGAGDHAPLVGWLLADGDVAPAEADGATRTNVYDHVPVRRLLDDRIPSAAAEYVRHAVRDPGPAAGRHSAPMIPLSGRFGYAPARRHRPPADPARVPEDRGKAQPRL